MVTAELAVTILTAFTLLIMMSWGVYLVVLQLRCTDVAAAVARQVARNDKAAADRARAQAPARRDRAGQSQPATGHRDGPGPREALVRLAGDRPAAGPGAGRSRADRCGVSR